VKFGTDDLYVMQSWKYDFREKRHSKSHTLQKYVNEVLGFCERASWANCEEREKTRMQQSDVCYELEDFSCLLGICKL